MRAKRQILPDGSLSDFSRMRSASVRFIAHTFFCVFYQVQSEKKY